MSCGVGRRHGLHLALLWLWHRPAATALIRPLPWAPPYALGAALKRQKKKKRKKNYPPAFFFSSIWISQPPEIYWFCLYLSVDLIHS